MGAAEAYRGLVVHKLRRTDLLKLFNFNRKELLIPIRRRRQRRQDVATAGARVRVCVLVLFCIHCVAM